MSARASKFQTGDERDTKFCKTPADLLPHWPYKHIHAPYMLIYPQKDKKLGWYEVFEAILCCFGVLGLLFFYFGFFFKSRASPRRSAPYRPSALPWGRVAR